MTINQVLQQKGRSIIGAAIEVHKALGPGLLESIYHEAMIIALKDRGHVVKTEVPVQIKFRNRVLGKHLRIDLIVDDLVILELKAVTTLPTAAEAQLLTYLKLTGLHLGYLINFHEETLTKGLRRLVHNLPETKRGQADGLSAASGS